MMKVLKIDMIDKLDLGEIIDVMASNDKEAILLCILLINDNDFNYSYYNSEKYKQGKIIWKALEKFIKDYTSPYLSFDNKTFYYNSLVYILGKLNKTDYHKMDVFKKIKYLAKEVVNKITSS